MNPLSKTRVSLSADEAINENDINEIRNNYDLKTIQISDYIPNETIEILNDAIFSQRNDIEFRVFGFYSHKICDLSFLTKLKNVENLCIDCIANVSNIDVLVELKKLKKLRLQIYDLIDYSILKKITENLNALSLSVGDRTSKFNCDCEWLTRFTNLETLYLGKLKKNINCLSKITSLKDLTIRGITVDNLSFIKELQINSLAIHWGAMQNFQELNGHEYIKSIELWRISKLNDISFLNNIPNLKIIKLDQLANIKSLPDLSNLEKLETITIDDLKKLSDISCLEYVKKLKKVNIFSGLSIQPDSVIPLLRNTSIDEIDIYTGNDKRNKAINKVCCEAGKNAKENLYPI